MPDPKKPMTPKQLKSAPVVMTPRQRVLDAHAEEKGRGIAEFRDGDSYCLLQDAKSRVGAGPQTGNGLTDSWETPSSGATGSEKSRYVKIMESTYDKEKEWIARRDGKPTGYDAAMRGTPTALMSSADALAKKKPLTPKQVSTAPMFEKKK